MQSNRDSALKVAEFLLQIKAVKLNPKAPFTWASGRKAPIYCDNRITLSYPRIRTFIRQEFVREITDRFGKPDAIAGVATGGIAHGALIAQELDLPFMYVRSADKGHGLGNRIEGQVSPGRSVVVVEDLISTGGSSLSAVNALREADCEVKGMAAIFTYGFEVAEKNFQNAHCDLVTLSDYDHLIAQALKSGYIDDAMTETLKEWRQSPETWNTPTAAHEN